MTTPTQIHIDRFEHSLHTRKIYIMQFDVNTRKPLHVTSVTIDKCFAWEHSKTLARIIGLTELTVCRHDLKQAPNRTVRL